MTNTRWQHVAAMTMVVAVLAIAGPAHAQHEGRDHASVAGRWTVSVTGPHGVALRMALQQDKTTVKGTLEDPHGGEFQLAGTFVDRKLTLKGTSGADIELVGEVKADGTMAGTLSGSRGDFEWSAKRAAGSQ